MTVKTTCVGNADELETVLEDLMQVERFDPPEEFRDRALMCDPEVYAQAERTRGLVGRKARELHWHKPFTTILDDSNPPFYTWFADGELNLRGLTSRASSWPLGGFHTHAAPVRAPSDGH